jgi:hypothetical protein
LRRLVVISLVIVSSLALAPPAAASQLVDRVYGNEYRTLGLKVSRDGVAMLTYKTRGRWFDTLAWGAINARHPTPAVPQVRFRVDYTGGWRTFGRKVRFRNVCSRYDGPRLTNLVAACKAPDGSYWAVQRLQRRYPGLGFLPWLPVHSKWSLHLSHWTGPLAKLEAWADWSWRGTLHHIFGRLTYLGRPVHGFKTNRFGSRRDKYGRLVYLDTFGSKYAPGWRRENAFVTHKPTGVFCYNFRARNPLKGGYVHPPGYRGGLRGPGHGKAYRLTVEGPGVTPDVQLIVKGLPNFDPRNAEHVAHEAAMNALRRQVAAGDKLCTHD